LRAWLPGTYPEWLGDRSFNETHAVRFPYVTGAMANGIATTRLVIAMSRAGMLGFFGAAGLSLGRVEKAVDELQRELGEGSTWGSNLIHSPNEPALEAAVADLYVRRGVRRVSAAAYLGLTAPLVRYACTGLSTDPHGQILRRNHVFAKISHPQVARHFVEPAPEGMLRALVQAGQLTEREAQLAGHVALAEDITAESDSGGHTDNRPLSALLPTIVALRDEVQAARGYQRPIRVGAAGGIGTPHAVAAAFALGAAYVLTGSVNQGCVESGVDAEARAMLAQADIGDVVMAPAADMFEQGVKVQVLKRGTMFAARARKLYELYRDYPSLDAIPDAHRAGLEDRILRGSVADTWAATREFWMGRDPAEVDKAEADPHHKMALVFRSYLGRASRWAIDGLSDRRADYQIWCGPAMGAFNRWTEGSFLADPSRREAVQVALNLLEGAAMVTRAQQLRSFGLPMPASAFDFRPRPLG
jgi:PfaD family protein